MKNNTLAIALASLLVGGVAVAAFQNNTGTVPTTQAGGDGADLAPAPPDALPVPDAGSADFGDVSAQQEAGGLEYADVIGTEVVTREQDLLAEVIAAEPVRETTTSTSPRQVCEDVVVTERLPERDGNIGGTVAGAVIGGLVGNQIGKGRGRRVATVAGAVGGGFAGREIDRRHVGGQVVERIDRQCHTVQDTSQSSRTVAWNVTYREPDGTTGTLRTDSKPAGRIRVGTEPVPVAWDVTYRYNGAEHTVRMEQEPGPRLPVIDGEVVLQTAAAGGGDRLQ